MSLESVNVRCATEQDFIDRQFGDLTTATRLAAMGVESPGVLVVAYVPDASKTGVWLCQDLSLGLMPAKTRRGLIAEMRDSIDHYLEECDAAIEDDEERALEAAKAAEAAAVDPSASAE
jgi:hypothetical protein